MMPRSFLFIPGDSERKLAKVDATAADAVILDLEDAVAPGNKILARDMVRDFLLARRDVPRRMQYWVRVNPLVSGLLLGDLAAVVDGCPDGIVQPKIDGPEDVAKLSHYLDALEVQAGVELGRIRILPVSTETARAPFALGSFADAALPRLAGLTWGAEDLSAALGASTNLNADGEWAFTYQLARSLCLLAARAADVPAIETLYIDYRDDEGLRASCRAARAEGFSGRIAIHPAQVEGINASFSPTKDEVAHALRIAAAFEAEPNVGTVGIDGRMYDIPHLKAAQRLLQMYEQIHDC